MGKPSKARTSVPPVKLKQIKPSFHALTIRYNGRTNSIVTDVGLTPAFDTNLYQNNTIPYQPIQTSALWDTGATNSVITPETVRRVGLISSGVIDVIHYGGIKQAKTYVINLLLPNNVWIPGIIASESDEIISNFGVIIGMDIISQGDFSITNFDGFTWMSYRIPSISGIDYVIDANRITYAGVPKYGPCPCGKKDEKGGRIKFIFCHGRDL